MSMQEQIHLEVRSNIHAGTDSSGEFIYLEVRSSVHAGTDSSGGKV